MERLILLCLLSPAIFARPHKTEDPNDEPFLPIHPVYPYSPKLIKRGTEAEVTAQLTSELYAPKADAKDTYSTSYSSNYQRDSYYPDYNPYLTNSTSSLAYPSYGSGEAYVYANVPYPAYNSYPAAYAVNPAASYPVPSYPNYYYQPPYYYPHYFTHALFPPPPPPLPSGVDYHETSQVPVAEDDKQDADKKGERPREDETGQDVPASQFVDGGNYIAGNTRDLDVQSSTYKVASPYNQLAQDVQVKNLPIPLPKATYRVIGVGAQPIVQNYPLPAVYVKAQQIEQMTSQTLADLLAQNAPQQAGGAYESNRDTSYGANDGSYENQDAYNPSVLTNAPSYVNPSSARSKPGVTYVIESVGIATKVNGERAKQQSSPSQTAPPSKSTKYTNVQARKPASRNRSQATTYRPLESDGSHRARVTSARPTDQTDKYGSYDAMSQSYGGTYSPSGSKQEQNYGSYQSQSGSYQSEGFTVVPQTPRSQTYQYPAYESAQVQQPQRDEINADNGNFGTKQYKG